MLFAGKILVTTGTGDHGGWLPGKHSEVIDVLNEKVICEDLARAPWGENRATGGLINERPLICGGCCDKKGIYGCFTIGKSNNNKFEKVLNHIRSPVTSLVVGNKVSSSLVHKVTGMLL